MDTLSRRRFLRASGVTGAAALLAGSGAIGVRDLLRTGATRPLSAGAAVLVIAALRDRPSPSGVTSLGVSASSPRASW
jgi:hypothetical protein